MSNLLTNKEKKLVRKEYHMRVSAVALTLFFFTCVLSVAELLPSFFYSSVARTLKENELERVSEGALANKEISDTLKRVDLITSFLEKEHSDEPLATNLIKEAMLARPDGVEVGAFSVESGGAERVLAISGVADTRADLISFVSNLGRRPGFSSTDVPAENLARAENISFVVRIVGDF